MRSCDRCGEEIGETCLQKPDGTIYCETCYVRYFAPRRNMLMEGAVWMLLFAIAVKLLKLGVLIWGFVV